MAFDASGAAYQRFMGEYSDRLAPQFADFGGVTTGSEQTVLDVGCGPGALTVELVHRVGPTQVTGIDPSASFLAAARERLPEVSMHEGPAERMPFETGTFDITVAQLVVLFFADPAAGAAEMVRVTRPGGLVAACYWDHFHGRGPLTDFWRLARELDLAAPTEHDHVEDVIPDLPAYLTDAGLVDVETADLIVTREFATFDDWWEPLTLGVGPVGDYVKGLDDQQHEALRQHAQAGMPSGPFSIVANALAARGRVPGGPVQPG